MLKNNKYFLPKFEDTTQSVENKVVKIWMILNQLGWHYIAFRKPSALEKVQKIIIVIIIACIVSFV